MPRISTGQVEGKGTFQAKRVFEALAGKPMAQFEPKWRATLAALK